MQQYGNGYYPRQYPEDEGVILIKAELIAADGYPDVVFYERVCVEAASDTNELSNLWKYYTKGLGAKVAEAIEGGIVLTSKCEKDHMRLKTMVVYELLDLKHYGGKVMVQYPVEGKLFQIHLDWRLERDIPRVMQNRAVREYLRYGI